MITKEIKHLIGIIKDHAKIGDCEAAHLAEDDLREYFIRYLAETRITTECFGELARLVLSTNKIKFDRYCS